MSHEHCNHNHEHGHVHGAGNNEKITLLAFLLTFLFMIVELVGGWVSGSLALMADAGHMMTDACALFLAWAGFYFGKKEVSESKTFGYFRFEVLAAFFNAIALFLITLWICYEAYSRFLAPVEVMAKPMFVVAVAGLVVNCLVFYILTKADKEHLNIKGAILHVLGDLLGSIGVIVAAIVIYFTGFMPIDSILSIFVCLLILRSAWSLMKNSLNILMEGTPIDVDIEKIEEVLSKVENVNDVSHIHVWAISSGKTMATLNISLCEEKDIVKTIEKVKNELEEKFHINHSTIEVGVGSCPLKKDRN